MIRTDEKMLSSEENESRIAPRSISFQVLNTAVSAFHSNTESDHHLVKIIIVDNHELLST